MPAAPVQFLAIARLTALEAIRRPVFLLIALSSVAGIVLLPLLLNYTLGDSARIIRDSALAVAGVLDPAVGGPSVPVHLTAFMDGRGKPGRSGPADGNRRRSIYIETRRNFLNPTLLSFDLPLPSTTIGRRTRSNVPAQSLALLNDPFFTAMAGAWSARVGAMHPDPAARVRQMHLEAFAREPTAEETDSCLAFVRVQTDTARAAGDAQPDARAWADLAHAFFNLKEFIYVP